VNLFQSGETTQTAEITRAVTPILNGPEASVVTRRGFLVEEVILEEATWTGADILVLGTNQKATWRRLLSRLAGNEPAVASFLEANVNEQIEVVKVDPRSEAVLADGGG